jgi:hypothetical protein
MKGGISMASKTGQLAILTFLLLSEGQASAVELRTAPVSVTALSGQRVRMGYSASLNNDCSTSGDIKARLADPPRNGTADIVMEKGFTRFPKGDQKFKCNEKQSDVQAYYYQSRDGFKGKDKVVIETFFSNGNYRKRTYNIDVR